MQASRERMARRQERGARAKSPEFGGGNVEDDLCSACRALFRMAATELDKPPRKMIQKGLAVCKQHTCTLMILRGRLEICNLWYQVAKHTPGAENVIIDGISICPTERFYENVPRLPNELGWRQQDIGQFGRNISRTPRFYNVCSLVKIPKVLGTEQHESPPGEATCKSSGGGS